MRMSFHQSRTPVFILLGTFALGCSSAWAHHPEIDGVAICDDVSGNYRIDWVSEAWEGNGTDPGNDPSRQNDSIDIRMNGLLIANGAYNAPGYMFSGMVDAPADATSVVLSAIAVADWGNGRDGGQKTSITVPIPWEPCDSVAANGRFTGGGHQIRVDGVRVTRGLTLHCDLLLSNNLEVNWQGNKFHMTEHMTTVSCTDDPDIIQEPPPAPIDTLVGVGTGRYNGVDGYTIAFTLVDAGEPGREDKMAILITDGGGNTVLDVPLQLLDGGNLQAHYDQPHK
ncbi:MAG: hypothetical protein OER91_10230 [Gammaproteobacteria bacterium]|nr:hypothetical protein [Gammaproteobacteria bacterium]